MNLVSGTSYMPMASLKFRLPASLSIDDARLAADKVMQLNPKFTASREEGKKIFGLIVVDDADQLVGMLSMYDILLFVQPKHMKIWGEMEDLEPDRLFDDLLGKVKGIQVGDIMTTEVVTIGPETHILSISDLMINKHIRRLPVSEDGRIIGMVFMSDVFYHMLTQFLH